METKKIGFVTNIEKDPTLQETKKMVDFVLKKGCEVYVSENFDCKQRRNCSSDYPGMQRDGN